MSEDDIKRRDTRVMLQMHQLDNLSPLTAKKVEARMKYLVTAECEYWQSKLKERDELLEEMANKSQESIEMMKFAERHGDVVGFRIWQKLHEVITDLLTRYSNLKAK